ncbi:hypothetical protein Tco_0984826 [Tanacetum coccineum]
MKLPGSCSLGVRTGKGLLGPNGGRCGSIGGRGGSMAGRGDGWLAKRSIVSNEGCGGGGLTVRGGKSSNKPKNGCGDVGGVEKISLTGSKLITNVEVCLDGCDGGSGREVNGGGVVLGVLKRWSRDVLDETIGESGGDTIGLDGGAVC